MGVLIEQRELLESEIDRIIFKLHSGTAFELIKSKNVCKFKYGNNDLLIDRLCSAFKRSVISCSNHVYYYRKLIFDVLTSDEYSKSRKFNIVIDDLEFFCKNKLDRRIRDSVICLVTELRLFRRRVDNKCICNHDKKVLQKSFDIRDGFSHSIEKACNLDYHLTGVSFDSKKIITMDSKFKTAYDDAISIVKTRDGYLLTIYITDVASYVCDSTSLYNHALQRGESIYTSVDNSSYIPMFPCDITREFFSLNSGGVKNTIAHVFKFSDDFDLISARVMPVSINVYKNYSFDEIDKINKDDSVYDIVYMLLKLTDRLKSHFNLDYHVIKEQNSTIVRKKKYLESPASSIITVCTLFLNSYIAEFMNRNSYPFVYRVNDTVLSDKLLNSSTYSFSGMGHIVNNGNCYGHVTNPIRSFASLLNQYFEVMLLVDDKYKLSMFDKNFFIDEWSSKLPSMVDELNKRLFFNSEYKDAFEKIYGKQLTRKK